MSYSTALRLVSIALAVWIGGVLPASSATRSVVLLFDERVELPGLAALESEFIQTLASNSSDHIETYRETMILRLVEGFTGPEIAEHTGMTPESVRVHLHRGMKLLRERLGGEPAGETSQSGRERARGNR